MAKVEAEARVLLLNRCISFGPRPGIQLGQCQRLAQRGDRNALVRLGFRPPDTGPEQGGLGIDQLGRERKPLLKTATSQLRAFLRLLHRLAAHGQTLVRRFEVEAGLFDLKVECQPQLALFLTGRFEVGARFARFRAGRKTVP